MSIRARLTVWFALVVAFGVAATSTTIYISTRSELNFGVEEFLAARATELVEGTRALPRQRGPRLAGDDLIEATVEALPFDPDAVVQALDQDGNIIATAGAELPVTATDRTLASTAGAAVLRTEANAEEEFRLITAHIPGGGAVQVARSLTETGAVLDGLRNRSIIIGGAVSILAALVGWVVTSRGTRALRKLTATAEHVASTQDLTTQIDRRRADEVGRLSASFDRMLAALRQSQDQQHQLVEDAAHELRTPLTTLRANVELLERAPELDAPYLEDLVSSMGAELGELSHLFDELIELATGTPEAAPFERVDLNEPAERALRTFSARSHREVETTLAGSTIDGNTELLERAIANLLINADKFTASDLPISLMVRGGKVVVGDRGPGIPAADRNRVFDRFYRSAATRSMPGSGLGLAIVKKIVDQHHGRVLAGEALGGGARVGFELPPPS